MCVAFAVFVFDLCCAILQVPAFETAEGVPIYESNAIAHYGEI